MSGLEDAIRVSRGLWSEPTYTEEIVDRLVEFVRLGFSGFNFILAGRDTEEQARRLATEVIPSVRAAT